jgi:AraC family transcriptional regulator of adaptative response / DNA-3-methyladenine glycosylase II
MKREDTYYAALCARDPRFDGKFFVGVKTTGIYCRPICPARPLRKNVEFYSSPQAAEKAGYRPCLRCRPESAPLSSAWIGTSAVVQRAMRLMQGPKSLPGEEKFAAQFGISARHLRRLFLEEIGKTPKQLMLESRLNLARKLLAETALPVTQVAFAAGFGSVRRFNDAFRQRFHRSPGVIRRAPLSAEALKIRLAYRPPFDFEGLLRSYGHHEVAGLERVSAHGYERIVEREGKVGKISVTNDPASSSLLLEVDFPDLRQLPALISKGLELDPDLAKLLKKHPGIRLPSGWDPFEVGVSTILGQLVSLGQARALVAQLIELHGKSVEVDGAKVKLFPSAATLATADLSALKTTGNRRRTLQAFAAAVHAGSLSLEPTQDVDAFVRQLREIRGIGPWTASYMALKVLRHTDAFPETDLILARALGLHPKETLARMSPWRGYCAALFWREYAGTLKKEKRR